MRKSYKDALLGVFCLVFVMTASGCDVIDTVKEYFVKPDKKETEQMQSSAAVSTPSPSTKTAAPMKKDALARVGSWSISTKEFTERLDALKEVVPDFDTTDPQAKRLVLEELIRQQLLAEDAENRGIDKTPDVAAAVEEFRRTLLVREVVEKITENTDVTQQEARDFYEERKDVLVEPAELRIREIVVDSQLKANELLVELLKGSDFGEVAKANSISKSASNGGDLGFLQEATFPAMLNALAPLEEGDISSVFKGPDGFYILKLEEKRGGDPIPYEDLKEEIIQNRKLFKQQQAILEHIEGLKKKIAVEVNEDYFK